MNVRCSYLYIILYNDAVWISSAFHSRKLKLASKMLIQVFPIISIKGGNVVKIDVLMPRHIELLYQYSVNEKNEVLNTMCVKVYTEKQQHNLKEKRINCSEISVQLSTQALTSTL